MTDSQNDDSMYENLSARLDEIFGVDEEDQQDTSSAEPAKTSPLQGLNAIVLTLEWEITDEVVAQLLDQVDRLKKTFQDDYHAYSLLRLLGSVGKYIQNRKADAHPSAMNLLNSLHTNLVKVVESEELSGREKSTLLQSEVKKFKQLKQVIADEKSKRSEEQVEAVLSSGSEAMDSSDGGQSADGGMEADVRQPEEQKPQTEPFEPPSEHSSERSFEDALASAVEEIKSTIRDEFKALRDELQSLKTEP